MWRTFKNPLNVALASALSLSVFILTASAGSYGLLGHVLRNAGLSLFAKVTLMFQILSTPFYNLLSSETFFLLAVSVLIGINITLAIFYIRLRRSTPSASGTIGTIGGLVAALLGVGCAACGSLILTSVAVSLGGLSLLAALPFGGAEIGYLGALLVGISTVILIRGINKPAVCPI